MIDQVHTPAPQRPHNLSEHMPGFVPSVWGFGCGAVRAMNPGAERDLSLHEHALFKARIVAQRTDRTESDRLGGHLDAYTATRLPALRESVDTACPSFPIAR